MQLLADDSVALALHACSVGVCLLAIAQIVLRLRTPGRDDRFHIKALAVFFAVFAFDQIDSIYTGTPLARTAPFFLGWINPLLPLLPVSLWFYTRTLTEPPPVTSPKSWRHMIPTLVAIAAMAPAWTFGAGRRFDFFENGVTIMDGHHIMAGLGSIIFELMLLGLFIFYGGVAIRRLRRHSRRVKHLYSSTGAVSLNWVSAYIIVIAGITALTILDFLTSEFLSYPLMRGVSDAGVQLGLCVFLGVFGLHQNPSMPHWAATALELRGGETPAGQRARPAYARSALTGDDCVRLMAKLDEAMRSRRLWARPDLTLQDMAEATGIQSAHVSQALNTHLGRNFYDYVNGWRIEAACTGLRETNDGVTDISLDVGFNSRSTFYAAFKKKTGLTPIDYRRRWENG